MPLAAKSSPPAPKTPASNSVLPKESDIVKGEAAFSLLQQWDVQGFFIPKGSIFDYHSAYAKLWQVWEQRPEFPKDLSMGLLRGEMVHKGLWVELANTTSEIAGATLNVESERLVVYQTTLFGLCKYRFNTRIAEVTLCHLMTCRRAECIRLRPSAEATTWSDSDLETLEQDLEALRSQLSSLQIEIEQKELEVGQCLAARDFAVEAQRKQEEIDMLEEALSYVE